jgi:2-(1,2-epoxy-1,2-dihydrophenyl)acetyl-CoA isomerase
VWPSEHTRAPAYAYGDVIATDSQAGIPIVRLNRPAERNTLIPAMLYALIEALHEVSTAGKPIVLTGSGVSFCAGADLNWLATFADSASGAADLVTIHHRAITTLVDLPVPVIAAVNGSTAGGGLGLALAADYILAAESASFITAYFRLGLTPDGGATTFLQRAIGPARTRELLLTNRRLSANEALAWGLINAVAPDAELLDRAVAFASSLAPVPPDILIQTRQLLDGGVLRQQLQLESEAIRTSAQSEFFQSAIARFRESHPRN